MTDQQALAMIVDGCIEDVLLGIATVEDCLDHWPEHRAELEPLLRAAVAITEYPAPEATPPDPARRAAFMAELRQTPQEQARFRMPRLPSFGPPGLGASILRMSSVAVPAAVVAIVAVALVWGSNSSTASAATLTVFAGGVEEQFDDSWRPVADGSTLAEGVTIRTLSASLAMLTFPDGSTATVDASTRVVLEQIAVNGARQISLRQDSGRIWNDVVPIEAGDSYVIHTPHAVVEAHGTAFETVVDGETAVLTAEGLVSLAHLERSVQVIAGQVVRATTQGFSAPEVIPNAGEVRVSGPVSAYLTSPQGAATGVLMNGLVFRQIPGIITTAAEELDGEKFQRIVLGDAEQGEYSLVLRRFAPGPGAVTVETPDGNYSIAIPENVAIARLPLEVGVSEDGTFVLRTLSEELQSVGEAFPVRVVESERSRQAEVVEARPQATEPPISLATEATNAPTAAATRSANTERSAPTRTAAAVPNATPDSWAGRLQDALARGNDRRIDAVLDEILEAEDEATRTTRLALLSAVMSDSGAAARIRDQADGRLVEEITTEATRLTPGLTDGLRSRFAPPGPTDEPRSSGDSDSQRGNSGSAPGRNGADTRGHNGNSPGNSGDAPGRNDAGQRDDDSPGNSGNAPGQSDDNSRGNSENSSGGNDRGNDRGDDRGNDRSNNQGGWLQRLLEGLRATRASVNEQNRAAAVQTPTPAAAAQVTATVQATPRATATPTATPTATATTTPRATPTPRATATASPTATATTSSDRDRGESEPDSPTEEPTTTSTPRAEPPEETAEPTRRATATEPPADEDDEEDEEDEDDRPSLRDILRRLFGWWR